MDEKHANNCSNNGPIPGAGDRRPCRPLRGDEIALLERQGNRAEDWALVFVGERFDPTLVWRCRFGGTVRLGNLSEQTIEDHGLSLSVGLCDSTVMNCDLGDQVCLHHAHHLARAVIGDGVIIMNVGRMWTTPWAKFGGGHLAPGESESARLRLAVANENGGRVIPPFETMRPADAALWAGERADAELLRRLEALTDHGGNQTGSDVGVIGDRAVILDCRIIRDVRVGPHARIEGADRLEELTIRSAADEPTRIGAGVQLDHGIVGFGCRVDGGAQASHFVLGARATLTEGACLTHTVLGDNSTVACGEVRNSLILPGHEQHHRGSFLIAATLLGQSNLAAGAVIGSNHNSRAADGELVAGRGFWPGLCASFKHPSRFASFVLAVKGAYPAELNVPLPFSLIANDAAEDCLRVMPAYWFLHNMYAVMRNGWKCRARDRRVRPDQPIEFESLAPDTIEEILAAMALLEAWTGRAWLRSRGKHEADVREVELEDIGRRLFREDPEAAARLEVLTDGVENSSRPVHVLKAEQAHAVYREMAHWHAVRTLARFMTENGTADIGDLRARMSTPPERRWVNLGGQLVPASDLCNLKAKIRAGELASWEAVHEEYDRWWSEYPARKAHHALAVLCELTELAPEAMGRDAWRAELGRAVETGDKIARLTFSSRARDFVHPFRRATFADEAEMHAVLGRVEDDEVIRLAREEAEELRRTAESLAQKFFAS